MFVDPPDQASGLLCPVCILVLRDPHLLSCCGKHLCKICLERVEAADNPCPCCNGEQFNKMLNKEKNGVILGLKVYCSSRDTGCNWTGELGDMQRHIQSKCEYALKNCPNGCGQSVLRHAILKHIEYECTKRPLEVQLKCLSRDMEEKLRAIEMKYEEKVVVLEATIKKQEMKMDEQLKEVQKKNEQRLAALEGSSTSCHRKIEKHLKDEPSYGLDIPITLGRMKYLKSKNPSIFNCKDDAVLITECSDGPNPVIKLHVGIPVTLNQRLVKAQSEISNLVSSITTATFRFPPEKEEVFRYLFGDDAKWKNILNRSDMTDVMMFYIPSKRPFTVEVCGRPRDGVMNAVYELESFRDNRLVVNEVEIEIRNRDYHKIQQYAASKSVILVMLSRSSLMFKFAKVSFQGGKYDVQLVKDFIYKQPV